MENSIPPTTGRAVRATLVGLCNAFILASTLLWPLQAGLAQTAALIPNAKQVFLNVNGAPLAGGSVFSYVPNTTVPKTTWSDPNQVNPNTSPVTLDAGGGAFIFGQGNYRQIVKDVNGNTIWDGFTSAYGSAAPSGSSGTDTAPVGTILPWAGFNFNVPPNWQLAYGQALSRTTFAQLEAAITISTTTGNCVSSSTTISGFADTSQLRVGAPVEASCLPTGDTVATIVNGTTITVSVAATATGTFTVTAFPWGNGDGVSTFNLPDLRGRVLPGADAMGGTAASRLTSTFYGANASPPAVAGGGQGNTASTSIAIGNVPTITSNQNGLVVNSTQSNGFTPVFNANPAGSVAAGGINVQGGNPNNLSATAVTTSATINVNVTSNNTGGSSPPAASSAIFSVIQPSLTMDYIIKVAPNTTGAGGVTSFGGMFGDIVCGQGLTCAPQGAPAVNTASCTTGTTSALGCLSPDGTTITVTGGGVISSHAAAGSLIVGTSTVSGGSGALYANGGLLGSTSGSNGQILLGVTGAGPQFATLSQDCSVTNAGVITCLKTNNVAFGTAANATIGSSGATVPLLNATNTFSGDTLFSSGRPWCDIRAKGAVQDSSTDDTAAWNACITQVSSFGTGGTVYVPPANGISCIKTAGGVVHNSGPAIAFLGASEGVSVGACGTDTTVLTLNVSTDSLRNFFFIGKGVNNDTGTFGASHPTLVVGSSCVQCLVTDSFIWGGSNAISVQASDAKFDNVNASFAYGAALVYLGSSGPVVGNWFVRDKFDQIYPQGYPGPIATINAWAATTAYSLGQIVTNQGFYLQNVHAGTSASSQPTLKNYGITFNDNTAQWQILAPQNYYGVQIDTNASENQFVQTDHTGPFTIGVGMTNTLAGTAPQFVTLMEGVIGQTISQGVNLHDGSNMTLSAERVGGALVSGGAALITNANWSGNLIVDGSNFLVGGGTYGIFLGAGTHSVISNNRINGIAGTDCLLISSVTDVNVIGNSLDTGCTGSIATTGTTDYYTIVGNTVHGVAISDGASGTHKYVPAGSNP
jgi:hypothetical protein